MKERMRLKDDTPCILGPPQLLAVGCRIPILGVGRGKCPMDSIALLLQFDHPPLARGSSYDNPADVARHDTLPHIIMSKMRWVAWHESDRVGRTRSRSPKLKHGALSKIAILQRRSLAC